MDTANVSVGGSSVLEQGQLVQMRLQPETMNSIDNLVKLTGGTENKATLVSLSVEIAEEIIRSIKEGARVYIETRDGRKERLKISGL